MIKTLLTALLFASTAVALPTVPEGEYTGKAQWKDNNGKNGNYSVTVNVVGDEIQAKYNYVTGTASYNMKTSTGLNGFYDVLANNQKVGEGYCMTVQCHYNANFNGTVIEESITFWQGSLYRVGSKKVNGVTIVWEEALKKVK
jgi:hypothetical protein